MTRRKRLELPERRAQLVSLGLKMFAERNYEDVSIDEVAQRAGISKGLLYHYFRSKRDFYLATVQQAAAELTEYLTPDPSLNPLEQMQHGIERYLSYVKERRASYMSLMHSGVGVDPEVDSVLGNVREQVLSLVLTRATPGGGEPSAARRTAVRGWVGFVEAASLDWLRHGDLELPELKKLCVNVLLQALASAH